MHGISKPNRNIFELSVLLNYFLTRYSGSDGKVPSLFFPLFYSYKVPGSPSLHSVSSFPSPAKNRPTLEHETLPTARPGKSTDMSNGMKKWFAKWWKGPVFLFTGAVPQVRGLGLTDLDLSPAASVNQMSDMWVRWVSSQTSAFSPINHQGSVPLSAHCSHPSLDHCVLKLLNSIPTNSARSVQAARVLF